VQRHSELAKKMVDQALNDSAPVKDVVDFMLPTKAESLFAEVKGAHRICIWCKNESPADKKGNCVECGGIMANIEASARPLGADQDTLGQGAEMINKSLPVFLIPIPLSKEAPEDRQYSLASLRPNDRFTFICEVPDVELELDREYQVVPARRGGVSFSDQARRTFTVPLIAAHLFPVRLTSEDTVDPGQRFYPGDKVAHKGEKWRGIVVGFKGMGYDVRPISEDPDEEDDGQGEVWVPSNWLRLIEKQKTTKNYVRLDANGEFIVRWGGTVDAVTSCVDLHDAMRLLFKKNRVAFNRFSRWLSDPTPDNDMLHFVDATCRSYLEKVDKTCWKHGR
jgi:hypothetical protein